MEHSLPRSRFLPVMSQVSSVPRMYEFQIASGQQPREEDSEQSDAVRGEAIMFTSESDWLQWAGVERSQYLRTATASTLA